MEVSINFDQFMEQKDRKGLTLYIFLLGDEYSHLDNDSSWVHYFDIRTCLVRLTVDEFKMLDIGVHPKIIAFRDGKEVKEFNGIPPLQKLKKLFSKI